MNPKRGPFRGRRFVSPRWWLMSGAFIIVFILAIGAISFLKIWRSTPAGFHPAIRISLLDRVQSWSLSRNAKAAMGTGRYESAHRSRGLAIANHPGDIGLIREHLRAFGRINPSYDLGQEAWAVGSWLLRLSRTNRNDIDLVVEGLEHAGQFGAALRLLDSLDGVGHPDSAARLRIWYHTGQYRKFAELWDRCGKEYDEGSLMHLYSLGVKALLTGAPAAFRELNSAYTRIGPYDSGYVRSRQIALRAHAAWFHAETSKQLFVELEKRGKATLSDQLVYGQLLIRKGDIDRIERHFERVTEPSSAREAMALVQALRLAGLSTKAIKAARRAVLEMGSDVPRLYVVLGNLLSEGGLWQELNRLSVEIRNTRELSELVALADYWEALTAWKTGRKERAEVLFRKLGSSVSGYPDLRIQIALKLLALGQTDAADRLVKEGNVPEGGERCYWLMRTSNAVERKDLPDFMDVTAAALRSDDEYGPFINNYLVGLITRQEQPGKALELSRQLLEQSPDYLPYRLIHAHSLILNQRWEEAHSLLTGLEPLVGGNAELYADLLLARFRLAVGNGDFEVALQLLPELNTERLMPETVTWIQQQAARANATIPGMASEQIH